ncbi:hypothetical protein [Actinacidiphila acidipaludis]|uniref:Uncharacterized protein n=1 Tax=Actinacidiphila acidipaludis TaxID=2873382 RepID=A0ABS7Q3D4_9ACTN|nr:hypothetical protein [Streptomyces acidipaludis]MBY8877640.1 hypothetical protein [Streptomyces acidipaludis]
MALTVHVAEYLEDCALVAGEDLARQPAFWLAHLLLTVGDHSPRRIPLGIAPARAQALADALRASSAESPEEGRAASGRPS